MILDEILRCKREELEARRAATPLRELEARAADAAPPVDFAGALGRRPNGLPAVIAEVKKASPSKGIIRRDFEPVAIARAYQSAGAAAISVLTDERFFQGSLQYLTAIRQAVTLPVLRKDFILDEYQIFEARAAGADAVLLIAAALQEPNLKRLAAMSAELGMASLVEVHDETEMETALRVGASLIGINNRNLQTFEVSLEATARLAKLAHRSTLNAQPSIRLVSESGIFSRADLEMLAGLGVDAVLIGEALMRERDVGAKLRELIA